MDEMTRKSFERAMAERKKERAEQAVSDAASKEGYNAHAFAEIYEQACRMSRKWFAL